MWRNRLARSAVNRKVDGSNPSRDVLSSILPLQKIFNKKCYVTGQLFLPSIPLEVCKKTVVYITWACAEIFFGITLVGSFVTAPTITQ